MYVCSCEEKTTTAFSFVSQHWLSNSRLRNSFGSLHFFMPSCFNEKKHNVLTQNYVDVAIISQNLADWRLKPALNLQEIHFKSSTISLTGTQLFTRQISCQKINEGFAFTRYLDGTFPWRKFSIVDLVS